MGRSSNRRSALSLSRSRIFKKELDRSSQRLWVRQEFSQEKIYSQYIEHLEPYASHIDEEVEDLFNELSIE